jgi:hypothetical protein
MAKRRKRRRGSSRLPTLVWVAGLVGFILIAAGLVVLTGRQGSTPNSSSPYPNVPRISPVEAHNQQQVGRSVIIDVRDAQFYQASHAAGALSVPEDELLAHINDLPTDKNLVFY